MDTIATFLGGVLIVTAGKNLLLTGLFLITPHLVNASPLDYQPKTWCRVADGPREFLLEKADAKRVVNILIKRYPEIQFKLHPTQNGFYAFGNREQILKMLKDARKMDADSKPQSGETCSPKLE